MSLEAAGVPGRSPHARLRASGEIGCARRWLPTLRQAFVPQPIVDRSPEQLRAYVYGDDPVSKRPFVRELLEGLTAPLDDEDLSGFRSSVPRRACSSPTLRITCIGCPGEPLDDCLPIVLPTEVAWSDAEGHEHAPDEIVGRLRPTRYRSSGSSRGKVAVNAVMAGAHPEYLPVILALAASGMTARHSSTTSWAAPSIVNGPIRNEIGMNSGMGAMGQYNHANATIGRADGILSQNLQGGSVIGDTYMGSLGNAYNYSATWAENEERSPWEPLHVTRFLPRRAR